MSGEPEPWQTNQPGPWMTIEGSEVAVWSLGKQMFRVTRPSGRDLEVEGHDEALALAHELAELERRGLA